MAGNWVPGSRSGCFSALKGGSFLVTQTHVPLPHASPPREEGQGTLREQRVPPSPCSLEGWPWVLTLNLLLSQLCDLGHVTRPF